MPFAAWILVVIFGMLFGFGYGHNRGAQEVQAKWDSEKLSLITEQRKKEASLQSDVDTLRKAYTDETTKLSHTVATLNDRMRNRPSRASLPASATSGTGDAVRGCTGAELYKPDSEFLVREAARADQIRLALIQCQTAYKKAQQASNER